MLDKTTSSQQSYCRKFIFSYIVMDILMIQGLLKSFQKMMLKISKRNGSEKEDIRNIKNLLKRR